MLWSLGIYTMKLCETPFINHIRPWNPLVLEYPIVLIFYGISFKNYQLGEIKSQKPPQVWAICCRALIFTSEWWDSRSALSEYGDSVFEMNHGGHMVPSFLTIYTSVSMPDSLLNFWNQRIFPDHLQGSGYSSLNMRPEMPSSKTEWTKSEEKSMLDPVGLVWEVACSML